MNTGNLTTSTIRPIEYVPRIVDEQVSEYLRIFGAIEIAGTKWCGKTWTARTHGESITYIDEGNNLQLAKADPLLMLEGIRPHIIDEWQKAPMLWNTVRHEVDNTRKLRGAWILTGSSTPLDEETRHSGAGRIGRVKMLPMTLSESGDSIKSVSLSELFKGKFQRSEAPSDLRKLIEVCCRGGWPEVYDEPVEDAQKVSREYLDAICEKSAPTQGKDPEITLSLIRSIARNLGQSPTYNTIAADMFGAADKTVSDKTIANYLGFLKRIYLTQEIPGWLPPARSPKRLRMKPKRYFADPSLAVAALGMSPDSLLNDWQTFGLVFENLCIRDLSVYAQALPDAAINPVRYYRDETGLEADAVIERADGSWAAFEFKVSQDKVENGISTLKHLRKKVLSVPAAQVKPPVFMAVITGMGDYTYQAEEGIYVIPIRSLTA